MTDTVGLLERINELDKKFETRAKSLEDKVDTLIAWQNNARVINQLAVMFGNFIYFCGKVLATFAAIWALFSAISHGKFPDFRLFE